MTSKGLESAVPDTSKSLVSSRADIAAKLAAVEQILRTSACQRDHSFYHHKNLARRLRRALKRQRRHVRTLGDLDFLLIASGNFESIEFVRNVIYSQMRSMNSVVCNDGICQTL